MMVQRRLVGLVREAPLPVTVTVACALGSMLAAVLQWFFTAQALSRVLSGADSSALVWPLVGVAAAVACRGLLMWGRDLAGNWTGRVVKRRLRAALIDKLLRLGPAYTSGRRTGDMIASVGDGVEALRAYVGFYLPQAFVSLAGPLVLVVALTLVDPVIGLLVLACLVALPFARRAWGGLLGRRGRAHWEAYEEFAASMMDAITGLATLRSVGAVDEYGERLSRGAAKLYRATRRDLAASLGVVGVTALLVGTGTLISVGVGAFRVASGALDPMLLLFVLFLAAECFRPQQELQNYWHEGFHGLAASHGIFALLDAPELLTEPARPRPRPTGAVSLTLHEVSYRYPTTDGTDGTDSAKDADGAWALDRVSIDVPAGTTLAVVGPSGAGKSTLVALLQRFLDPDQGAVLVGGVDLRELSLVDARSLAALVSQDVHLFAGTVADNLRLARPDADHDDLEEACRRARIHHVIESWPDGYQTVLGERGLTISGGERQRLAIARALLADAPLLLLDEATSSVDGANEQAMHAAIAEASRGRTTVVVAHRMSTVLDADRVVVLDSGRIVESGEPGLLLAQRHGRFAELVAAGTGAHDLSPRAEETPR
ncbi:ABC transporter ATP-binding protein/permease [Nocardioides limicola]|uniref:ABC transporter ATP-binding protein/permease n=1 Tax=Nocardioides limicola TaxID=2803368 RepID=UPI00193BE0C3|nr:ABC transporter ATP-binding protein [Nocardioides sp. DJM-14]